MSEVNKLEINGVEYDLVGDGNSFDIHELQSENAIADTDELPFYDISANASRKTTWSNIKTKLKTYFDTVYLGIGALSGYATQAWVNAQGFLKQHQSLAAYRTSAAQDIIDAGKASAAAVTTLEGAVAVIEGKIPSAATTDNQLADKAFVNSTVGTNTAYYISNNGQPFTSLAQLQAYSGTVTNNDYAFVVGTDSAGNTIYTRYKYNSDTAQWAAEYVLNNSSFTAVQWAAIQSGITAALVASYNAHLANGDIHVTTAQKQAWSAKQDTISDLDDIRSGAAAGATALQEDDVVQGTEVTLADVATSGDYNDLDNLPTIPSLAPYRTEEEQDEIDAGKQDKAQTSTVTIAVADWGSGTTVTKNVTGVTASNIVFCDSSDVSVQCTAQGAGTLTFTASSVPSEEVTVKVVILP